MSILHFKYEPVPSLSSSLSLTTKTESESKMKIILPPKKLKFGPHDMVQNGAKTTNATDLAVAKFLPPEFNALHGKSAAEVFLDTLPPSCLALTCDLVGQYFGFNGKCWEPLTDEYICHPSCISRNQLRKNLTC